MSKGADLTGVRFGRAVVLGDLQFHRNDSGRSMRTWLCLCDCGREFRTTSRNLLGRETRSCGCLVSAHHYTKHGYATRKTPRHPLYSVWLGMNDRCHNPRSHAYSYYGARGIQVCEKWRNDFLQFLADVGERSDPSLTLDRINNDAGYEPRNVRWATPKMQANNRRPRQKRKAMNGEVVLR